MTSTHDLAAVTDALGVAFGSAGLTLEPSDGLRDVAGTLTAVQFDHGDGSGATPATLAVVTDNGLDLFDAAVAALQKSMPGLVAGEPTALTSVAELDTNRSGVVAFHTILSGGSPVGLLIVEEDRRRADTVPTPDPQEAPTPGPAAAPAGPTSATAAGSPVSGARAGNGGNLSMLSDVKLNVTVDLGRQLLALSDVMALSVGSVVELDRAAGAPVDIRVNGILFGRGEVVVVDEEYAVRVIEILETPER